MIWSRGDAALLAAVGYGRVGSRIARTLIEKKIPFVVVEMNREKVEKLRARGYTVERVCSACKAGAAR